MDLTKNYAVDNIHLDDYSYPYPPNQVTNLAGTKGGDKYYNL